MRPKIALIDCCHFEAISSNYPDMLDDYVSKKVQITVTAAKREDASGAALQIMLNRLISTS